MGVFVFFCFFVSLARRPAEAFFTIEGFRGLAMSEAGTSQGMWDMSYLRPQPSSEQLCWLESRRSVYSHGTQRTAGAKVKSGKDQFRVGAN